MTEKSYRGTGGPMPARNTGTGPKFKGPAYVLTEVVGDGRKKVTPFMLRQGTKNVDVVVLDHNDFDYAAWVYARFKANNSWSNYLTSLKGADNRGCPLAPIMEKQAQWFLCGTVIDRSEWVIPDGKNKGQVKKDKRRLLLIPVSQVETFEDIGEQINGWRGAQFSVSRSNDQKSPRIGSSWFFKGHMSEEQMLEEFEAVAAEGGYTAEQYIQPYDYAEVLKPLGYEELQAIGAEIQGELNSRLTPSAHGSDADAVPF